MSVNISSEQDLTNHFLWTFSFKRFPLLMAGGGGGALKMYSEVHTKAQFMHDIHVNVGGDG